MRDLRYAPRERRIPDDPSLHLMVETRDLSRDYTMPGGVVHAIREVSIRVGRGQLVALRGRSGSGKTTLLSMVGALDRPTRGSVAVESSPGQGSVFSLTVPRVYPLRHEMTSTELNWTIDAERVPVLAAPEAVVELLRSTHGKRWRLLTVKGTKPRIILRPSLLQLDVIAHNPDDVRLLLDRVREIAGVGHGHTQCELRREK